MLLTGWGKRRGISLRRTRDEGGWLQPHELCSQTLVCTPALNLKKTSTTVLGYFIVRYTSIRFFKYSISSLLKSVAHGTYDRTNVEQTLYCVCLTLYCVCLTLYCVCFIYRTHYFNKLSYRRVSKLKLCMRSTHWCDSLAK